MRSYRTVLEQLVRDRRQTLEEFVGSAEVFAREHGEAGTISVRHLQRLVAGRGPGGRPLGPVRPATARLLERIFGLSVDELLAPPAGGGSVDPESDVTVSDSGRWDQLVEWLPDTTRRDIAARLDGLDLGRVRDRGARLRDVGRSQLAGALRDYYAAGSHPQYGQYGIQVGGQGVLTSVLTRPDWAALAVPLDSHSDQVVLDDAQPVEFGRFDQVDDVGVERLVEAAALGVRLTNEPLYRLLTIDVRDGVIAGRVGLVSFGEYALTMDLLEDELAGAVALGLSRSLPLRDRYLPDLDAVLDPPGRVCAGGVAALTAIARPADPYRGPADYALLVQERSGQVLNGAGRLAVIPKGFHEPLTDVRGDARIGSTLLREMEEELFGRVEVDSTAGRVRAAAPMHPGRLSAPMRWLLDGPGRLRTECTGFGLNLVSGNYEFAALVVIDDEEFWPRFGGVIEANWEAAGLRVYSSLDDHLIGKLIMDESWSNEGLFSFLQGIRRLREIGGPRVRLPDVEVVSGG